MSLKSANFLNLKSAKSTPWGQQEACHLVETSRLIYQTLIEADEFESNFCKKNSRIPKTQFRGNAGSISMGEKAEVFAFNFIKKSRAQAKGVHQGLKKNNSFKAFGCPLEAVINKLKRRLLVDIYDTEELNADGRVKKKYRITYNSQNVEHTSFLVKYQALFPGDVL